MTVVVVLLLANGVLGAVDTLWYHEYRAALPRRPDRHRTELVEDVRLFGADPITGQRGSATDRLGVEEDALVFSYDHQVLVEQR